jgi:predicted TIM-barrel fold metal-dependent hydrolase
MNYPRQLRMTVEELGAERVLFAADWPFEPAAEAVRAIDAAPLSDTERADIYHRNAERVFRL